MQIKWESKELLKGRLNLSKWSNKSKKYSNWGIKINSLKHLIKIRNYSEKRIKRKEEGQDQGQDKRTEKRKIDRPRLRHLHHLHHHLHHHLNLHQPTKIRHSRHKLLNRHAHPIPHLPSPPKISQWGLNYRQHCLYRA